MKRLLLIVFCMTFLACTKTNQNNSIAGTDSSVVGWYKMTYEDAYGNNYNFIDSVVFYHNYFVLFDEFIRDTGQYPFTLFTVNFADTSASGVWNTTNGKAVLEVNTSFVWLIITPTFPTFNDEFPFLNYPNGGYSGDTTTGTMSRGGQVGYNADASVILWWENIHVNPY